MVAICFLIGKLCIQWRIHDRWGRQPSKGASTYDFAKILQKLHEIERIWIPRGRVSLTPSLDLPLI